jgi:hypothetical protein
MKQRFEEKKERDKQIALRNGQVVIQRFNKTQTPAAHRPSPWYLDE